MAERSMTEKAKDKVKRFVYDPRVRRASRFATSLLETLSLINNNNPLSTVAGVISLLDLGVDAFDIPIPTKIEQYGNSNNLKERISFLGRVIVSSGLPAIMKPEIVCIDDKLSLKRLKFEFGSFYYVENIDTGAHYNDELDRIHGYYYTTQDFPFEKLFSKIWEDFDDGIFLSIASSSEEGANVKNLKMHRLAIKEMKYVGNKPSIEKMKVELKKYRDRNLSRAYMLIGPPGTGKSSFAMLTAKHFTNRILKIDPAISQHLGSGEFDFIIRSLQPEVIIFDDFDSAISTEKQFLFILEMIKQHFPNITIFSTVNNFDDLNDAIKRPGRIDKRIWFDFPDEEERREVIIYYLNKFDVKFTEGMIDKAIIGTKGMTQAYIKELCIRIDAETWDVLGEVLKEFRMTIGEDINED